MCDGKGKQAFTILFQMNITTKPVNDSLRFVGSLSY